MFVGLVLGWLDGSADTEGWAEGCDVGLVDTLGLILGWLEGSVETEGLAEGWLDG